MSDIDDIQRKASLQVMKLGLIGMIVNGVIDDKEDLELWLEYAKEHLLENFDKFYEGIMETMEEM